MVTVEKVAGNRVTVHGVGRFVQGDQAEVGPEMAEYLCDERGDFERVDATAAEGDIRPDASDRDFLADYVDEHTVSDIESDVAAGDYDDQLELLAAVEREGQDRVGVHDAIAARRDDVEGDQ
jgi:hypothetical protein